MDESNTKSNLRRELYSLTAVRNEFENDLMYCNKCKEDIQEILKTIRSTFKILTKWKK